MRKKQEQELPAASTAGPSAAAQDGFDRLSKSVRTSPTGETRPKGLFADPYAKRPHSPSAEKEATRRKTPSEGRLAAEIKFREATAKTRQESSEWQRKEAAENMAWRKEQAQAEAERQRARDAQRLALAQQQLAFQDRLSQSQERMAQAFMQQQAQLAVQQAQLAQQSTQALALMAQAMRPLPVPLLLSICVNCGAAAVAPGSKFCPQCGTPQ